MAYTQAASNDKNTDIVRVLIPVIILVILLIVGKNFLSGLWAGLTDPFKNAGEGLNILDTKEEKKEVEAVKKKVKEAEKENTAFDPNFYKKRVGTKIYTMAKTTQIVKQIWGGIGAVYDSPEEILAAVKQCTTKGQLSFVSKVFSDTYSKDLLEWLELKLDTTEQKIILGKIIDYSNKLK